MNLLTPDQVNALLDGTPAPSVYLVGAGGCGMSGLGHLLLDLGCKLHGSDLVLNEEVRQLRARGAEIHQGHSPDRLREAGPALVVYSSAVLAANPELQAARASQVPIVRRAVLLSALQRRQRGVCVAGMHGKTTTTALLAYALGRAGADPSYAVGALTPQLPAHARFGGLAPAKNTGRPALDANRWFVAETDESDGTLREFSPDHAIFLNVDEEHLDYYANIEAVCQAFAEFAERITGRIIFCADDPRLSAMFASRARAVSYGFHPRAAYRAAPAATAADAEGTCKFTVWKEAESLGEFETSLMGGKNILNATAVVAFLHQVGFAPELIAAGLRGFRGAARRQQELYRGRSLRLFDDYGHHPREIEATLTALKGLGGRRLLVAFQPHRFTRSFHLAGQFARCFHDADRLWLTDIYSAGEATIPGVSSAMLADAVRAQGQEVEHVPSLADLNKSIRPALEAGDVLLYLGAGDITKAAHEMAESLRGGPASPAGDLFSRLQTLVSPQTVLLRDELLSKRTTLRVGGNADFYAEPASESELARLIVFCRDEQIPVTIWGRGSNLLVRDGGVRGLVVSLGHPEFSRIEARGTELRCGAGARLKAVSAEARRRGLAGLEFLEGIPGSVGGAMRMNAGAMGSWMFEVIGSVRFMDHAGQAHERRASEVYVEYRGCPLFKNHIALGATLQGKPADRERIEQTTAAFNQRRWTSQPAMPSAGCVFKNPSEIPAGKLIEELGLKGAGVGGASVSEVHGNFIVNRGGATARDVLALIEIIRERARADRGIELQTEVEILGESQ